jgi:glycine betaine/choline ABC-type transport system substrate-binding protein
MAGIFVAGSMGCDRDRPLTVGSKNFTEQVLLGEIVAQHLEHRLHRRVDRKLNLGGTLLAHQALVNGDIDLYPEYTGTALTSILKMPAVGDSSAALATVRAAYRERFGVEWLAPLGFNNTFAMVIRGEDARKYDMKTLSQAAAHTPGWTLGMGYEFQQRPDGLQGFLRAYPLTLKGTPKTMDLGLLYQALEQRDVGMVVASATDGRLSQLDVVVLEDDRHYFPPYDCVLAVRADVSAKIPLLQEVLTELSGRLTDQKMRQLNYQVDGEHRPVRDIAQVFLREAGLNP